MKGSTHLPYLCGFDKGQRGRREDSVTNSHSGDIEPPTLKNQRANQTLARFDFPFGRTIGPTYISAATALVGKDRRNVSHEEADAGKVERMARHACLGRQR